MAQVVSRDFASVLAVDYRMGKERNILTSDDSLVVKRMFGYVSACWVYLDSIHRIIMDYRLGFATTK